jgi:N-acetylneuraminate lyase
MEKKFNGIVAALVTPYDKFDEVNYKELKKLVRYLIGKGIDGFYVGGSTGEAFLLSQDERKKILEAVLEENNGEKQVIAHVGNISTDFACDLAKHAKVAGADAVSAISPFYYKFAASEIKQYYFDIMDASDLPMFIYNFPNLSGFSLTSDILDEYCKNGQVGGVKFTSNDFYEMERMRMKHPELTIWNGYDEMFLSGLMAGADGGIGSTYNMLCPIIRGVYDNCKAGNITLAQDYQSKVNEVVGISRKYNNIFVFIKAILALEGLNLGHCRKPFAPLPESAMEDIKYVHSKFVLQ